MSFAIEMDMPLAFDLWSRLRIRCPRTQSRDPGCQGVAELCGPGREENPGEALSLRSSGLGGRAFVRHFIGQHQHYPYELQPVKTL